MDTNRLLQFCTVARTGNLRRAAELLGISHSGLSKALKTLETELGVKLTQPSGRGIVLTDEGLAIYERSAPFFEALDTLLGRSAANPREVLRLGSSEVFTVRFVGQLLRQEFANQEIEIHELIPGRLESALASHRIDVGITYDPVPQKGIDYLPAGSVRMGAFALPGRFKGMPVTEIPFAAPVAPLEGAPTGAKGLDAWPEIRYPRNVMYRVDLLETGIELVRQGLCAVFIPRFVAELHNRVVRPGYALSPLPLPKEIDRVSRPVYVVKRESTIEDRTIRLIAKALRAI